MRSHRFIEDYTNQACKLDINEKIVQLTKEGLGIRSTARIMEISVTTLLKRIVSIARNIIRPIISRGKIYEVDELCIYIKHKKKIYLAGLCFGKEF
ncbi:IS1-like element transposase [Flavobacterium sp. YO12]|uniref:IS1-like element transposase n=1 Tax=Flavobacterium sp. YO12 TaxID=1920029 RepID=UPI00352B03F7